MSSQVSDEQVSPEAPEGVPKHDSPIHRRGRIPARYRLRQASDWLFSAAGLVLSLACLAPMLVLAHTNITGGYSDLFSASFGSLSGVGYLFLASVPLVLVSLGVAIPVRAGLFNIGGEGQLLFGALGAVLVATRLDSVAVIPGAPVLALCAAALAGAAVGAVAGALKAWRGINEIVTTIMLNFLALYATTYLIDGPLADPKLAYAGSQQIDAGYQLGAVGASSALPVGFIAAVAVAAMVWWFSTYTRIGWRHRLVGLNPRLADRAGVNIRSVQFWTLTLGGALAGLGGGAELLGNQLRLGNDFSPGWGFSAVAVALLARGNALAVVPFALFFGFLANGSQVLQFEANLPGTLVLVLAGAPVLVVAAALGIRNHRNASATELEI